jgi:1,4-alpha-glucan branching enzyme
MKETSDDPLLHEAATLLQAPIAVRPGLRERTLQRGARQRRRRLTVAGSLALALAVVLGIPRGADAREVTFAVDAPDSRGVQLVGDFTSWQDDAIRLTRGHDGQWRATVSLPPGRYRFAYLLDGHEWRTDPRATSVPDGFGQATSVLTIVNE